MVKARTKAAKLKAKRGRPKMEGVAREPNGRVSRSGIDHGPADVVALDARRRHLGLTQDQAKDQKAGSFIGYLNLIGPRDGLSDDQYKAATNYLGLHTAYLRAINAPGRVLDGEAGALAVEVSDAYIDWVIDTKEVYSDCRKAIQEAQNENRHANLWAALDLCVIQDQAHHHMIGDLRLLTNCLARFFRI